ncbi:MAG: protein kinase [Polyangiaceae bacterium]
MKSCPHCRRGYPDDAGFCPVDGTGLIQASLVPVASPDDPRLGTKLCGRYELRRVVADGGMGRVYEGIDRQTNTRIAVKVLHDDVSRDEVAVERFKREAEISAALPHDHIVQVTDFQKDASQNLSLLVMEFLEGEELRFVLKREGVLPPERVIRMLAQVAIGLDAAHSKQYVHRDLKPDNIFLCGTREGDHAKLLDFGSVKDKNKDSKKLTVMGTTIGSPFYMAPEQAQGLETLDARADVWALGAIAYECIVGKVPFEGTNGPQILLAIMTKQPQPPTKKGKGAKYPIPSTVDTVIEDALAKNPNTRIGSVGALAQAFGEAYGLTGSFLDWAKKSQPELKDLVDAARPRIMSHAPAPLEAAADPFAAPVAHAAPGQSARPSGTSPIHHPGPSASHPAAPVYPSASQPAAPIASYPPQGGAAGMDAAFEAARLADMEAPMEVPKGRPGWVIPVVIGAVIGIVLLAVVMLAR